MILDLILAAISFAGLMAYGTIGVAVCQISRPKIARRCADAHGTKKNDKTGYEMCGPSHNHLEDYHGFSTGILWPFMLGAFGFAYSVMFLAKGPTRWGFALADLPRRAEIRRENRDNEIQASRERIKELESQLEAEGVLTSVG